MNESKSVTVKCLGMVGDEPMYRVIRTQGFVPLIDPAKTYADIVGWIRDDPDLIVNFVFIN